MLKPNSKQARQNIREYIMKNADFTGRNTEKEPETFADFAALILAAFRREKYYDFEYARAHRMSEAEIFADWAAGLPSILDTCYYYNRSAVDDLGEILQETEAEKARFTEEDAEKLLTSLIYRELIKA